MGKLLPTWPTVGIFCFLTDFINVRKKVFNRHFKHLLIIVGLIVDSNLNVSIDRNFNLLVFLLNRLCLALRCFDYFLFLRHLIEN